MSSEMDPNYIYARNINAVVLIERYTGHRAPLLPRIFQDCGKSSQVDCITIIITLEGIDEIKTEEKNDNKTV